MYIFVANETTAPIDFDNLIVIHKTGHVLEMNDYYPFGMRWYNNGNPLYKYKFGGKELQTELNLNTYDFHARQQDPQLGRFWGVDPMADARINLSSFNYVQNNPIGRVDPTGMLDGSSEMNEYGDNISARSYSIAQSRLRGGFGSEEEFETMYQYENQLLVETQTTVSVGDPTKVVDKVDKATTIVGGGIGVLQEGINAQYNSSSITSQIWNSTKYSKATTFLSGAGKVVGAAGNIAGSVSLVLDFQKTQLSNRNPNKLSYEKFSYRASGFAAALIATALITGPTGAVVGTLINGGTWAGEKAYDGVKYFINEAGKGLANYEKGWIPSH